MIQHPVPKEHLTAIGDIAVSFALLESSLKFFVWELISKDQMIGQIITAEIPFKGIRSLTISLFLHKFGKNQNYLKLNKLMKDASDLEQKRNQIIHCQWGAGKDKEHITRIKTSAKERTGLKHEFETISITDLNDISFGLKQIAEQITRFWNI